MDERAAPALVADGLTKSFVSGKRRSVALAGLYNRHFKNMDEYHDDEH